LRQHRALAAPADRFPITDKHDIAPRMGQERVSQALGRIKTAIARIEAAASGGGVQPPATDNAEVEGLREAHEALRGKVQSAIAQIDRLLETEGGR
jgi:hypothetical protein